MQFMQIFSKSFSFTFFVFRLFIIIREVIELNVENALDPGTSIESLKSQRRLSEMKTSKNLHFLFCCFGRLFSEKFV